MRAPTSTASSRRRIGGSKNGRVNDKIDYLSAIEEGEFAIAQANAAKDAKGNLAQTGVLPVPG